MVVLVTVVVTMVLVLTVEGKCVDQRPLLPGPELLAGDEEEDGGEGEEVGGSHGLQECPALPI